uniref:Uncharacterized protein n=1 Tax=Clytia hemisphaerica TaxID=252671 RepID=A0A7M5X934_9CNID
VDKMSLSKNHKLSGETRKLVDEKVEKIKKGYDGKIERLTNEIEKIKLEIKRENDKHPGKMKKLKSEYHETRDAIDNVKGQIEDIKMNIGPHDDIEHMVWGAETFFQGKKLSHSLYDSYEEWFKGISKMMEDNTPYRTSKYIFMKRDMDLDYFSKHPEFYKTYFFQGVENDDPWDAFDCTDDHMFMFEDLYRGLWEKEKKSKKKVSICQRNKMSSPKVPKQNVHTRQLVDERVVKIKKGYEEDIEKLTNEIEGVKLEMNRDEEFYRKNVEKLKNEYHETKHIIDNVKGQIEDIKMKIGPHEDIEHMVWGVETFFQGKKLGTSLYDSYEEWFKGISKMMEDNTPYRTSKYIFMKRDSLYLESLPDSYTHYIFTGIESDDPWDAFDYGDDNTFMFEDLYRGLWEKASLVLLHPQKVELCLEFERTCHETDIYNNYSEWCVDGVTNDFHEPRFAMMVGILNKISE